MVILGLDGALGGFSTALLEGERLAVDGSDVPDALEAGLARLAGVLAMAGRSLADLDRIAVGIGPGSFTGVRIAVAYAKALAMARALPLVGVSSYDVVTPDDPPPTVLAVVAGRPGVISARLRTASGDRTASGPIATVLDTLLATCTGELAVAGATEDVTSAIGERGIDVRVLSRRAEPPAATIARIGRVTSPAGSPHAVGPDYGEVPAATLKRA